MAKIHFCTNPYSVRTGDVPVRFGGGELLLEDDKGNVFRVIRGELVQVDAGTFNAGSFKTTDWEVATAVPGKKRSVKRAKKDDESSADGE